MSRRTEEKEAKRARIHTAAKRLFADKGFAGTTIAEIARAANVGTGPVFLYAPDKGALLAQVFCSEVDRVQQTAFRRIDRSLTFERKLMKLLTAFFDYYGKDQHLARVFLKELLFSSRQSPEVASATHRFVGLIAALAAEGAAAGEVRGDVDPFYVAAIVFGVYWTSVTAWLAGSLPSKKTALAHLQTALHIVMTGVAARSLR